MTPEPTAEPTPEPTQPDPVTERPDDAEPRGPSAPSPVAAAPTSSTDDRVALLLIAVGLLALTAVAVGVALREDL